MLREKLNMVIDSNPKSIIEGVSIVQKSGQVTVIEKVSVKISHEIATVQSIPNPMQVITEVPLMAEVKPLPLITEVPLMAEVKPLPLITEVPLMAEVKPLPLITEVPLMTEVKPLPLITEVPLMTEVKPLPLITEVPLMAEVKPLPLITEVPLMAEVKPLPLITEVPLMAEVKPLPLITEVPLMAEVKPLSPKPHPDSTQLQEEEYVEDFMVDDSYSPSMFARKFNTRHEENLTLALTVFGPADDTSDASSLGVLEFRSQKKPKTI
jgi:hypothetical protein